MVVGPTAPTRAVENWIPTSNPFCLPEPPAWFKDELYAFDPELRIFPSTNEPVYRVMRTVRVMPPWTVFMQTKPDTAVAIAHRLTPVTSVLPQAVLGFSWARVLLHLAEHDQHQFDNAEAVTRQVEGFEERQERRIQVGQADEADARAIDFYRAYRGMDGSRVSLAHVKPEGARTRRVGRRKAYRPVGAGAGAFFTGRGAR